MTYFTMDFCLGEKGRWIEARDESERVLRLVFQHLDPTTYSQYLCVLDANRQASIHRQPLTQTGFTSAVCESVRER